MFSYKQETREPNRELATGFRLTGNRLEPEPALTGTNRNRYEPEPVCKYSEHNCPLNQ